MTRLLSSFVFMLLLLPAIVRAQCASFTFSWEHQNSLFSEVRGQLGDTVTLIATESNGSAVPDSITVTWHLSNGQTITGDTVTFQLPQLGARYGSIALSSSSCDYGSQSILFLVRTPLTLSLTQSNDSICVSESSNYQGTYGFVDTVRSECETVEDTAHLSDVSGQRDFSDTLVISCYNPSATIQSATDLISLCLNLEHSFLNDLRIELQAPNGATVELCPASYSSGGASFLGEPVDNTSGDNGVGYEYCFTELNPTYQTWGLEAGNYQYSFTNTIGTTYTGKDYLPAGSYLPEDSYQGFIGTPVNGQWILNITDEAGLDDGYLFNWSLNFNPAFGQSQIEVVSDLHPIWTTPNHGISIDTVNQSATFNPDTSGYYSINYAIWDSTFGTHRDTTVSIFVDTFPVPSANDADVCVNGTFPWLVNQNTAFKSAWYYPDTTTLWAMGDSVAPPTLATADTHYVYLKATSRLCGSAWDSARYIRYPALNIATQNATVLSGQTVTLGATASNGSGSYSYSWVPSNFLTGANTANPTTLPLTSDVNFLMTVTDNVRGCSRTRIIQVEVLSPLSVSAGTSDTLCLGDSILLQGSYDNNGAPVDSLYWTSASGTVYADSTWITPAISEWFTFHGIDGAFTDSDSIFISVSSALSAGSDLSVSYCYNATPTLDQLLNTDANTGGYWLNSLDQIIDPFTTSGFGTYRYIIEQSPCTNDTATYTLLFNGNGPLPASDTARWCANSGLQYGIGITVDTDTASVGFFAYPEVISNGQCTDTVFHFYEIKAQPEIQWATQAASFCIDDSPVLLNVSPSGGVLSGNGLVGDYFDPSLAGAGVHELIYSIDWNGCTDSDTLIFTVTPLPVVGFNSTPDTLCINNGPITLNPFPAGGTLSGSGISGLVFNPAVGGVGTHTILYNFTDPQGCENADSIAITVVPTTTPSIQMPDSICLSSNSLQLSATPLGGSFFGPGVSGSTLNVSANTVYTVGYSFTNSAGCSDTAYHAIYAEINPTVTATDLGPFCIDQGSLSLNNAQPLGGTYLSTAISGQSLNLGLLGAGVHQIDYAFTTAAGCADTSTFTISIDPSVTASSQGVPDTLCAADAPLTLLSSAFINSFIDDSLALQIDPAALDTGWHIVQTVTFNTTCSDTVSQSFWIGAQATLVAPTPSNVCINDGLQPLPSILPSGGLFTGPGIVGSDFNPNLAGPGNHTFWYHYQSAGGCLDSVSFNWIVTNTPSLTINDYGNALCENDPPELLDMAQPQGGTYSGPGVTSGFFDPQLAGAGTHTLTYSYSNAAGCTSDTSLVFDVLALPNTILSGLPDFCVNDPAFALTGGFPVGGTYSGVLVSNGQLDPVGTGIFQIAYTYFDTITGCDNTAIDSIEVFDLPPVPTITQVNNELVAPSGSYQYRWYFNGTLITGVTGATHIPSLDGDYVVEIENGAGCINSSLPFTYSSIGFETSEDPVWSLYPNPAKTEIHLKGSDEALEWTLFSSSGQMVAKGTERRINIALFATGKYVLQIVSASDSAALPLLIQR